MTYLLAVLIQALWQFWKDGSATAGPRAKPSGIWCRSGRLHSATSGGTRMAGILRTGAKGHRKEKHALV